ncbi:ATPase, T2SS/T4P/T4SS family [Vibrio breoganii]
MTELIDGIIEKASSLSDKQNNFRYHFEREGINYRCQILNSIDGKIIAVRRGLEEIWSLERCFSSLPEKVRSEIVRHVTDQRLCQGGMIVVAGTHGNGKSTTMGAILHARLLKHGGHAVTIEDPAELPLSGRIGKSGFCVQTETSENHSFADGVKDSHRAYPTSVNNIMMIGEVRDPETAELALRSAIDGRLIITTVHADSCVSAIKRLLNYACDSELGKSDAEELLASSLRCVIHQEIVSPKLMHIQTLFDTNQVRGALIKGSANLAAIEDEVRRQFMCISNNKPLTLRELNSARSYRKQFSESKSSPSNKAKIAQLPRKAAKKKKRLFGLLG